MLLGVGGGAFGSRRFAFEDFLCTPPTTAAFLRKAQLARLAVHGLSPGNRRMNQMALPDSEASNDSGNNSAGREATCGKSIDSTPGTRTGGGKRGLSVPRIFFSDKSSAAVATVTQNIDAFRKALGGEVAQDSHANRNVDDCDLDDVESVDDVWERVFTPPEQIDFLHCSLSELSLPAKSRRGPHTPPVLALLLNPPYGVRLNKRSNPVDMYAAIARRVCEINTHVQASFYDDTARGGSGSRGFAADKRTKKSPGPTVMGYIICPDVDTWSAFVGVIVKWNFKVSTTHFTHGGKDTRLVTFATSS